MIKLQSWQLTTTLGCLKSNHKTVLSFRWGRLFLPIKCPQVTLSKTATQIPLHWPLVNLPAGAGPKGHWAWLGPMGRDLATRYQKQSPTPDLAPGWGLQGCEQPLIFFLWLWTLEPLESLIIDIYQTNSPLQQPQRRSNVKDDQDEKGW